MSKTPALFRIGAVIIALAALAAVFGPWMTPFDPTSQDLASRLAGPSLTHPLGLDELGRDMLARVLAGARISFLVGLTLCQIAPGANGVNLATLVGTALRGAPGMLVALLGMVGPPAVLVCVLGVGLEALRNQPWLDPAMAGLGAAAIGLTLSNAIGLTRGNVRTPGGIAVTVGTAIAIGVLRLPLLPVLLVAVPVSLLLAARKR